MMGFFFKQTFVFAVSFNSERHDKSLPADKFNTTSLAVSQVTPRAQKRLIPKSNYSLLSPILQSGRNRENGFYTFLYDCLFISLFFYGFSLGNRNKAEMSRCVIFSNSSFIIVPKNNNSDTCRLCTQSNQLLLQLLRIILQSEYSSYHM